MENIYNSIGEYVVKYLQPVTSDVKFKLEGRSLNVYINSVKDIPKLKSFVYSKNLPKEFDTDKSLNVHIFESAFKISEEIVRDLEDNYDYNFSILL